MKKNKKQILFILTIAILAFVFKVNSAFAANVSFDAPATANVGDKINVTVNAETDGVLINSAELTIGYDDSFLSFSGYSDTNSVIKLWIETPSANAGQITLSGIIPGGVTGLYDANKKGLGPVPLVHLFFVAKKPGAVSLSFVDSKILEQDGKGTALPHDNISTNIMIKNNPNGTTVGQDQTNGEVTPPENSNNTSYPPANPQPDTSDPLFWVIIALIISGILGYKLLKSNV
jgi:hypothetical protein